MTEKLIQAMNCMNSTTYRFLKAHVEKLFLSRRNKISYVWAQIFRNITGEQTPFELANLFPHWEKNIPSLGKKYSHTGNNNKVTEGHSLCALFLRTFLVLVMMVIGGVNNVWADGVFEGIWYIANDNTSNGHPGKVYNSATDAEKWYLVPAADPQQSPSFIDAYYSPNHANENGDPNKPFLATYKTGKDLNSIWIIKESDESGYYFVIHALTGKYVIYEPPLPNDDAKRKSMHLQTIDNNDYDPTNTSTNDKFKFGINSSNNLATGNINIYPKSRSGWYWNPAGQNNDDYHGQSSGEKTNLWRNGLVGVYNNTGTNSIWHFEDASSATALTPVISDLNEETNTFTITSPAAAFSSFRYTTDGSTTPTASVGTPSDGTSIFPTAIWQVQAVGVFGDFVTPVAGPKTITPVIPVTPTITYNNTTGEVTISSTDGTTIYYTASTSGSEPSAPTSSSYDGTGQSPITISGVTTPTIFKAIATKSGFDDSDVATQSIEKLVSPSVSFVDATQKVSITTNSLVEGATNVYTTDGNNPTPNSTAYSEAISLTGTTTVKAMTIKDGYINSDPVSVTVTKLASPSISKSGSTVTLSKNGDGTETIHYTTDGTTPTQESSPYSAPFTLEGEQKYTIKAIAAKTGYLNSVVAEQVVDNRSSIPAPTITYTDNIVTITASDYGDEIYYTTDGSTPTTSTATHFTSTGTVNLVYGNSYTIKAIASNGNINSSEATETIDLSNAGYSGIYFIRNNANTGDYYMYPVGGNSALVKTAKKTDEDAIWKIEIVGDYYHIIHYKDGKYLVAKDLVNGVMADTETVSLDETDNPGENALFEITRKSGHESDIMQQIILIRPKAATVATSVEGHIYLNTRGGNNGTNKIGLFDNTGTSEWNLVRVPAKPTFTVNDINVTISSDLGDVHYTIDGTNPTSSSTSGKNITLAYGPNYTVKAISIYHDTKTNTDWTSEIAISDPIHVALLNPIITRSGNNVTITNSQVSGVTFRYTFSNDGTFPDDPVPDGAGTDYTSALPITANARNVFKAIAYNTVDASTYTSDVVTFVIDLRDATTISSLAEITNSLGNYKFGTGFTATGTPQEGGDGDVIGTSTNPFRGTIDGNLVEFELSSNSPLFDYVQDATIKNVIISNATISTSGNAGAIANNALGATRIYNCGVLATSSTVASDKDGYTKITTCSSTISGSGSGYVGGIVGLLDGSSRVINCFSYANITRGNKVGGIVGWNNVATTSNNLQTMVMNCMFYGDITGGTSKAPIYNGSIITNDGDADGVNNFNYFWSGASYVQGQHIDVYNCALAAETRYLQRFEFFRQLLNSNRELAAWWATGDTDNKDEMMKWVMEPSQIGTATPYPILKNSDRYPSVVNIDVNHSETYNGRDLTVGPKFDKTLSVTIRNSTTDAVFGAPTGANITTTSLSLKIMDKDPDHFNFNYYKVQLPYYNDVGTGNYTGNRVVTGWKIVSISGGTNSYSTATTPADATASVTDGNITLTTPYNFADRNCTDKDKYGVSGRVFSQGAYFDVPEGVTSITIEPYWAKAVYLSDAYWDKTYQNNGNDAMATASNVSTVGGGIRYENGKKYNLATHSRDDNGQIVYTSMSDAIASKGSALFSGVDANSHTVYDYAVVLVGNYHHNANPEASNSKPYTVTSIDLDGDNEPDYSYILRFNSRVRVHPVRIDFLNAIGLGMAQKTTGGTGTYNFGIMQPKGWFESTNTALFRMTQFEYDLNDTRANGTGPRTNSPIILQGGIIEQWVTVGGAEQEYKEAESVSYYHVGGNVWFKEFHIGVHQDKNEYRANNNTNPDQFVSPHPPISVTGGDFNEFYLTGLYNTPNNNYDDNAECYINGGRFGKVAGTGMQGIGNLTNHTNGNIIWQIDNADIDEFYAGGINAAHVAEGNIYTVISNSRVDQFCGGPKFGDMNSTKKVVTNADNCTFRAFFGAGYGGNSYNRRYPANKNNVTNITWNNWVSEQYKKEYNANYNGVETRIDYQFLPMSNNTSNVARLFVDYVSFSLATTHDVTSKLTGCTITTRPLGRLDISDNDKRLGNFYGGGSLGKVNGPIKSILTNCTVEGNVFGAGYSATLPTVDVMNNSFQKAPLYDQNLGAYLEAEPPTTTAYTWEHADEVNSTATAINTNTSKVFTTENLEKSNLGSVSGAVTLTITTSGEQGRTVIGSTGNSSTGNVYGGGDESYVYDEATPANASIIVNIEGDTEILGNVYGGGNKGAVSGSTTVNIKDKD